ncbi:MAG: branched-chain amino acid ABC transporter permease [Coriobacteriales bacterium]|jgi:branched-chain amino acid transport system permease protein|nr:branched-chain amino acid ABC transporter permease [Coriobacteriales bacterium]
MSGRNQRKAWGLTGTAGASGLAGLAGFAGLGWMKKRSTPVFLCALLLVVGAFVWWLNIPLVEDIFTISTVTLIMVLGFQLFMGNSGILNWSYVGYVGIGAFASAIFSMTPQLKSTQIPVMYPFLIDIHMPFWLALIAGGLVAGLIAAIVAWPLMRLSDAVGAITQFALLIVINVLLSQWQQVTNGPRTFTLGGTRLTTLWLALGVALIIIVAVYAFKESSLGLRLRASRDDRYAAYSSGINMIAVRYFGYIISAIIGGIAGGLYSHYILSITASSFYMGELFVILSMVVIGGSMSVSGAFFGTVLVTVCQQVLRQAELLLTRSGTDVSGTTEIVLAIMMILFLIWRPSGITGGGELSVASIRRRFARKKTEKNVDSS